MTEKEFFKRQGIKDYNQLLSYLRGWNECLNNAPDCNFIKNMSKEEVVILLQLNHKLKNGQISQYRTVFAEDIKVNYEWVQQKPFFSKDMKEFAREQQNTFNDKGSDGFLTSTWNFTNLKESKQQENTVNGINYSDKIAEECIDEELSEDLKKQWEQEFLNSMIAVEPYRKYVIGYDPYDNSTSSSGILPVEQLKERKEELEEDFINLVTGQGYYKGSDGWFSIFSKWDTKNLNEANKKIITGYDRSENSVSGFGIFPVQKLKERKKLLKKIKEFQDNKALNKAAEYAGYLNIDSHRGVKESNGKLKYELDWSFVEEIAKRMQSNKKGKYPAYNWQKPINKQDLKDALTRHFVEIMKDNYKDEQEELGHLTAIACNAMMLHYQLKHYANEATTTDRSKSGS